MKSPLPVIYFFAAAIAALLPSVASKDLVSVDTATEAVNRVFAPYPKGKKEIWPISGDPRYTPVRPLQQSTFASLREYFSSRQQGNVDQFLQALSDLTHARDRLAKKLDMHEKWWPTGIDLLKVDAVLTQDLLTRRSESPDKMNVSIPRPVDKKLEVTIQESYTEHGQDRVLGPAHRTSLATLIPERNRWVIDEIKTTTTDAYGETSTETLSQRLRKAIKPLRAAERDIQKTPQTLEVRKPVKMEN
jgi:hypothetical protein